MRDPAKCVPTIDGPFALVFTVPLSVPVVRLLTRTSITPTQVTVAGFILSLAGSIFFLAGTHAAWFAGALVVQFSFILDGADGTLARVTGKTSYFGAWLDRFLDALADIHLGLAFAIGAAVANRTTLDPAVLLGILATNVAYWSAWNITTPHVPGLPARRQGGIERALAARGVRMVFGRDLYLLAITIGAIFFSPELAFWIIMIGRNASTIHCLWRTL